MQPFTHFCGIDVGKSSLDYCFRELSSNQALIQSKLPNELDCIAKTFSAPEYSQTLFVCEYTGSYSAKLLHQLSTMGHQLSVVSPLQSKSFMSALGLTNKNDKQAAHCLSLLGQYRSLRLYQAPSEEMQHRKQLLSTLKALEKQQRMLENQLHAMDQLPIIEPQSKAALKTVLQTVKDQIDPLKERLYSPAQDADFNRKKSLASSVKGIGEQTAEALLLASHGMDGFADADQLSKFLGLTPHSHDSGTSVRKRGGITKYGSHEVRGMLFMCAHSAIRYNQPCKELFQRLRANGKPYKVAMVAVMHKLVKQVFACVTKGVLFDNQYEQKTKGK